ncbi:hypothetical protein CHLNCDRAFT_57404 [Chlorella variabilis]|uniref:Beta-carotene isomerase D27-like C-terminal domain-containing protein n=1 Tax=Chlorella variabilis TaxID=554065 RepID=E1ZAA6_CHLVA|nr:hypothetical protein CHLNCDRAFT_57404 [Chlorella variabilis]EFN57026.1 hypothetical protein CHLNCDRAFT_57404 [Chlorella variabilis]|eukprot:XP_005849128.1 hypothetical protein CHLNCDRAFT_57404 [Chlorella variabilis]
MASLGGRWARAGRPARGAARPRAAASAPPDPFAERTVYRDNVLDRAMIYYFSSVMSKQLGGKPFDGSWDGFVDLSREIMRGRNSAEQQETVAGVLAGLLPPQAPERFRRWFPLNKFNAETNAFITVLGFAWLVGASELKEVEVEFEGRTQKWMSGVKIKKCRYLESSGCVGMCTNMCKLPTQKFFTETFGLPLTMDPNFEDLSCEMVFGRAPPPVELDKVYSQPCFTKQCNLGTVSSKNLSQPCPKIDTERSKKEAAGLLPLAAAAANDAHAPWQPK